MSVYSLLWSPSTRRHVVRSSYVLYVKQNRRSKQVGIIRFRIRATNTSTSANYANIAYVSLTYNMASAILTIENSSKRQHCHLVYLNRKTRTKSFFLLLLCMSVCLYVHVSLF